MLRYLTILLTLVASLTGLATNVLASESDGGVGGIGIRLVDAPVERQGDPRARIYVVDHLEPGETISRRVEIVNTTSDTHEVDAYVGAARLEGGEFGVLHGRAGNELTSWASMSPSTVRLPPDSGQFVTFELHVPQDATSGERYGVIWAEPEAARAGPANVRNRVGIRLYISVGPGAEPPSDFEILSLRAVRDESGDPLVEAEIRNTGDRAIDLVGELTLTDGPAGLSAGPFPAEGGLTLAPDDTGRMTVRLDPRLPSGPWLARLVAESGTLERAVEATIVFPDAAGESSEPVQATEVPLHRNRGFLIPLALGLIILTVLLLALFWWWRRRQDDDEEEKTGANTKQRQKLVSRK